MKEYAVFGLVGVILVLMSAGCIEEGGENQGNVTVNATENITVAASGDIVKVDYVGRFLNGTVFDTSYENTAKESGIYNPDRNYEPLEFKVGEGEMIKGFDEEVVGMKIGEKKNITIPPEKAYGEWDPNKAVDIPRVINLTIPEFKQLVPGQQPVAGKKYMMGGIELEVLDVKNITRALKEGDRNVVFYHVDTCPWCRKMEPWVAELKNESYEFHDVYNKNPDYEAKRQEFSDVLDIGQGVPQFGCRANGELHVGAFASKEELKKFADDCRNASGVSITVTARHNPIIGMMVNTGMGQARISDITDTIITLDYNPPLAGKTLIFEIAIVNMTKSKVKYVPDTAPEGGFTTFKSNDPNAGICVGDGKPIIFEFSTTWCPHCKWIKSTFDETVKDYVDSGKIVAHHWELDINDDTLTAEVETSVPGSDLGVYQKFNPGGSIPTYVFGCKYYRIGNGYESQNDLASEEKEFMEVIEHLIKSAESA